MKLTTAQINALAYKIDKDLTDEVRNHNSELTKNQVLFYKKYINKNKTLKELYNFNSSPIQNYLREKHKEEFEAIGKSKSTYSPYGYDRLKNIKNEIILQTIECDNLDKLIESVKAKFVV